MEWKQQRSDRSTALSQSSGLPCSVKCNKDVACFCCVLVHVHKFAKNTCLKRPRASQ